VRHRGCHSTMPDTAYRYSWDTPDQREAGWKQWAMERAVTLLAAKAIASEELEAVAERIYRWTAFPTTKRDG